MKNIELFEYLNELKKGNNICGVNLADLYNVLTNEENNNKYEIAAQSEYFFVLKNKSTGELTSLFCVEDYYNLQHLAQSSPKKKFVCRNAREQLTNREYSTVCNSKCAACHIACIRDYYDKKITKK